MSIPGGSRSTARSRLSPRNRVADMERRRGHRLKRRLACAVSYKGACERGCVADLSHDGALVELSDAGIPDPG